MQGFIPESRNCKLDPGLNANLALLTSNPARALNLENDFGSRGRRALRCELPARLT